jgi:hypothetical protein
MTRPTLHEHHLEDFAAARFAEAGHVCIKFVSPGFPGVLFIEFKAPGQRPRRTQPVVIRMLREMGHRVEIVDTFAQVDTLLKELAA